MAADSCPQQGYIMPIDCTTKGYINPNACKKTTRTSLGYMTGIIVITVLLLVSLAMNGLMVLKLYKLM